jgi:hypothetical protein
MHILVHPFGSCGRALLLLMLLLVHDDLFMRLCILMTVVSGSFINKIFSLHPTPRLLQPIGLHCLQGRPCHLPSPHCRTLPKEAFPQGIVPHRRASCMLLDAQGPQLW